jgi:hypothetical protein
MIMAFVYIFEQVFDSFDAPACLNINVTVEEAEEVRIVRDDPSVIQFTTSNRFLTCIITTPINRICILSL